MSLRAEVILRRGNLSPSFYGVYRGVLKRKPLRFVQVSASTETNPVGAFGNDPLMQHLPFPPCSPSRTRQTKFPSNAIFLTDT